MTIDIDQTGSDRRPVMSRLGKQPCPAGHRFPERRIAKQADHRRTQIGCILRQKTVDTVNNAGTGSTERRRHNRDTGGHCLENLEPRATSHPDRNDCHGGTGKPGTHLRV